MSAKASLLLPGPAKFQGIAASSFSWRCDLGS